MQHHLVAPIPLAAPEDKRVRKLLLPGLLLTCLHPDVISLVVDYQASINLILCQSILLHQNHSSSFLRPTAVCLWDKQIILACGKPNSLSFFAEETGQFMTELQLSTQSPPLYASSLAVQQVQGFDPDLFVLAGDRKGGPKQILVWNLNLLHQSRAWPTRARCLSLGPPETKELYCSTSNNTISIISTESGGISRTFGSYGHGMAHFSSPWGLTVDSEELFIADSNNHRIQVLDRKSGHFIKCYGTTTSPSGHSESILDLPEAILVHGDEVVIADTYHHRVMLLDRQQGSILRSFGVKSTVGSQFNFPCDMVLGKESRLYVCDFGNGRIQVFE